MNEPFRVVRRGRTDEQLIADHIGYEREKVEKAERMERTARLCFYAGMVTLGVSLYLLGPIIETRALEFMGAFIESFWNSPFSPF